MAADRIIHHVHKQMVYSAAALVALLCSSSCLDPTHKPIPPLRPPVLTADSMESVATPVQPGTVTPMPLGTLYQLVQSKAALIYDVRPSIFYKLGHIPGAISFPKSNYERDIAKHEPQIQAALKNQRPVVIYCTDIACPDAMSVATQLAERGYNVFIFQDGYEAWKSATN